MHRNMLQSAVCGALVTGLAATLAACGGGGGSSSANAPQGIDRWPCRSPSAMRPRTTGPTIGVKVLSIALVPQGGGSQRDRVDRAHARPVRQPRAARSAGRDSRQRQRAAPAPTPVRCSRSRPTPATCCSRSLRTRRAASRSLPAPAFPPIRSRSRASRAAAAIYTVPVTVNFAVPLVVSATADQCARSGVRPGAPGVHRRPHAAGRHGRDALGGELQRPGAPSPDSRHRATGAAAHLRYGTAAWRAMTDAPSR